MQEIRDRLLAEEPLESREWVEVEGSDKKGKRRRKSEEVNKAQRDMRRLSLPAKLTVSGVMCAEGLLFIGYMYAFLQSEDMTQKGIVEKRTWEFESRYIDGFKWLVLLMYCTCTYMLPFDFCNYYTRIVVTVQCDTRCMDVSDTLLSILVHSFMHVHLHKLLVCKHAHALICLHTQNPSWHWS